MNKNLIGLTPNLIRLTSNLIELSKTFVKLNKNYTMKIHLIIIFIPNHNYIYHSMTIKKKLEEAF